MATKQYIRHPIKPTELGQLVLRARFSERETQAKFAARFRVSTTTINNWERGKTSRIQKIHREILDSLVSRLRREGRLLPEPILTTILIENVEKDGNAYL